MHNVSDVRQIERSTYNWTISTWSQSSYAKLKKYTSPSSDQIPVELIQAGGEILLSEVHKHINSIWNKEKLPDQWDEFIIVPPYKKDDKTYSKR
jgi:hypothetical protein